MSILVHDRCRNLTNLCVFRALCLKFPRKHLVMMTFLSSMLRDDVRIVNYTNLYFVLTGININLYNVLTGWV